MPTLCGVDRGSASCGRRDLGRRELRAQAGQDAPDDGSEAGVKPVVRLGDVVRGFVK